MEFYLSFNELLGRGGNSLAIIFLPFIFGHDGAGGLSLSAHALLMPLTGCHGLLSAQLRAA